MRDLQSSDMRPHTVNDVSASCGISSTASRVPFLSHLLYVLDEDLCKKNFDFHIFFFFWFSIMILSLYIDFTRITALNTATDDVTN